MKKNYLTELILQHDTTHFCFESIASEDASNHLISFSKSSSYYMEMFHLKKEDLIDDIDGVLTAGDLYCRGNRTGTHMLFV